MGKTSRPINPVSFGCIDSTDKNNCTARALSNATDMPIWEARDLLKKHGRKDHEGCYIDVYEKAYAEKGLTFVGWFGSTQSTVSDRSYSNLHRKAPSFKGMTLETFCKVYNRGSYVVLIKGHATCIRGGKLIEHGPLNSGCSVVSAWKV